jgi:hypothetical protein
VPLIFASESRSREFLLQKEEKPNMEKGNNQAFLRENRDFDHETVSRSEMQTDWYISIPI